MSWGRLKPAIPCTSAQGLRLRPRGPWFVAENFCLGIYNCWWSVSGFLRLFHLHVTPAHVTVETASSLIKTHLVLVASFGTCHQEVTVAVPKLTSRKLQLSCFCFWLQTSHIATRSELCDHSNQMTSFSPKSAVRSCTSLYAAVAVCTNCNSGFTQDGF
jgi:hypothetical protein